MNSLNKQYAELIKKYKNGNMECFDEIRKKANGMLIWLCQRIHVNDRSLTYEDLHQVCLIALFKAVKTYDPAKKSNPISWIYTIARNDLIKLIREENAQVSLINMSLLNEIGSDNLLLKFSEYLPLSNTDYTESLEEVFDYYYAEIKKRVTNKNILIFLKLLKKHIRLDLSIKNADFARIFNVHPEAIRQWKLEIQNIINAIHRKEKYQLENY